MQLVIHWPAIALRLILTILAGAIIGFNRGERGRPAGMRTTILVAVSAALAMILCNILLSTNGMTSDSFVKIDPMRLPLGILSGIGFIGGGTILRRESLVVGVTTAATLWFVTLIGLCFGAGEIGLGITSLVIGFGVLWGLWFVEQALYQESEGTLDVIITSGGPSDEAIRQCITSAGSKIISWGVAYVQKEGQRRICCDVRRKLHPIDASAPPYVAILAEMPGVPQVKWQPAGSRIGTDVTLPLKDG